MTDAEKIHYLEKECFSDPWSLTSLNTQLSSETAVWLVYEEKGEAVGYALGTEVCGEAELYRIAVLSSYRRKGLGERLLSEFTEKCIGRKAEKIFLEVRSRNIPAIALYKKAGFAEIALRKGYYGDDDALIFEKKL
ncbi:MAG: ribosomal protein S18-alanine N-acetyltransferase [Ruminiclostridium sp.]|nr:ribosomal protein S18-alanine N-acetyltransferase [Ruminiclostridium sp.]